jgi:CheY-like chemotaxis protein
MVVDDDVDFVATIRPVLEEAGYDVTVACNGRECIGRLDEARPDLILLDVMMSTWGEGFAVAQALRAMQEDRSVRVILVSSLDLKSELEPSPGTASLLPVDACLVKPVSRRQLLSQVAASLRRARDRERSAAD